MPYTYINDQFLPEENAFLHFRDLSILRGYGVFDFLKIANGIPVFADDHLVRLFFSANEMRLPVGKTKNEIREIITELIMKNKITNSGIRISITGGYASDGFTPASPNFIVSEHAFNPISQTQFEKGIKLVSYQYQRQLPEVKSIDYMMAIHLQPLLKEKNADEILYHQDGTISECPRSNIFIVTKDQKLITPANNILKGVTRNHIMKIAREFCEVEEKRISLIEMADAAEVFISSTTKIILPVNQIDDRILPCPGAITTKLHQLFTQLEKAYTRKMQDQTCSE